MSSARVLLVGGGSGGHVFPLVAVADALRRLDTGVEAVFVGTPRGMEKRVVPERGYSLELLDVLPLRGGGVLGALKGGSRAANALPAAYRLLKRLRPAVVFSIGGYAAGPISLAARLMGIPLALMEPNSVIGLANRLMARLVQRAYVAFDDVERHFPEGSVLHAGVALRAGFAPAEYRLESGCSRLLVLGGSQGAKTLNEIVPAALARVASPLSVVHQAGAGKDVGVRERYSELGPASEVRVEAFIADVPAALTAADLVIARAGAGAVAEIAAVGRPSILVPYPHAAGDHQRHNALALERAGAGICLPSEEVSVERVAQLVSQLCASPERLERMAEQARRWGRPNAAEVVARDLLQLAGRAVQTPDDGPLDVGRRPGPPATFRARVEEA